MKLGSWIFVLINSFLTEVRINRNQSIGVQNKSMDWFLYDKDLRHERVDPIINAQEKRF